MFIVDLTSLDWRHLYKNVLICVLRCAAERFISTSIPIPIQFSMQSNTIGPIDLICLSFSLSPLPTQFLRLLLYCMFIALFSRLLLENVIRFDNYDQFRNWIIWFVSLFFLLILKTVFSWLVFISRENKLKPNGYDPDKNWLKNWISLHGDGSNVVQIDCQLFVLSMPFFFIFDRRNFRFFDRSDGQPGKKNTHTRHFLNDLKDKSHIGRSVTSFFFGVFICYSVIGFFVGSSSWDSKSHSFYVVVVPYCCTWWLKPNRYLF